jgi:hypothetical protein
MISIRNDCPERVTDPREWPSRSGAAEKEGTTDTEHA